MSISRFLAGLGIASSIVLSTSCTRVRVTTFDARASTARRTAPDDIRFYETQRPRCAYREVGHVTASSGFFASWSSVVRKARERAAEIGGDAIVSLRESTRISGATVSRGGIATRE